MANFIFKLQAVLDTKQVVEEQKLSEFTEKKSELDIELRKLKNIQEEKENLIGQLRDLQYKVNRPSDVQIFFSYIDVCTLKEEEQILAIENLRKILEEKRIALLEAMKERKVLEKLKSRDFEEYKANITMEERTSADETAILRFRRAE